MGVSPYEAHFNSLESCRLARRNLRLHSDRQTKLKSLYSTKPNNIFRKGDRVLIRTKKHSFHKYSPIAYPTFSDTAYTIDKVHKEVYPFVYSLAESSNKKRRYYGFELLRLDPTYDEIKERNNALGKDKIFVEDVRLEEPSKLRSGRAIAGKEKAIYQVWQNGNKDTVGAKSLELWKTVLGEDILVYGPAFSKEEKAIYKV